MKRILLFSAIWMLAWNVNAQISAEDAMKKLDFLTGEWQGTAKAMTGPSTSEVIDQHEKVEFRLGGKILLIEGKGYQDGELTFNALAVLSFDENLQEYKMKSWLHDGRYTEAYWREEKENQWEWGFEIPQGGKIRFVIALNESGQWTERGHYSPDGDTWYQNFEMTLNKK